MCANYRSLRPIKHDSCIVAPFCNQQFSHQTLGGGGFFALAVISPAFGISATSHFVGALSSHQASTARGRGMCKSRFDSSGGLSQLVQIIGPRLHHAATLGQVRGSVVRGLDLVLFAVRELPLDHVGVETQFV